MTLTFPKNTVVTLKSNKDLGDFVHDISQTIINHINYVDDPATNSRWTDLVCNGILNKESSAITVTTLARMLEYTDPNDMNKMGPVVKLLFQELPVLSNYWDLVKVNVRKSVQVCRFLHVIDNSKLLAKIAKQSQEKEKHLNQPKIQTTLKQHVAKASDENSVSSNDDDFTTPKRTVPKVNSPVPVKSVTTSQPSNSLAQLAEDVAT